MLSQWSNYRPSVTARWLILHKIFFCLLFSQPVLAAPFSTGRLSWDSVRQVLSGSVTYVLPVIGAQNVATPSADEFWLLPNRDLGDSPHITTLNREQREFRTERSGDEWPISESGLGALVVSGVRTGATSKACPRPDSDVDALLKTISFSRSSFEFAEGERVLRVPRTAIEVASKSAGSMAVGCRYIDVHFVFYPRLGSGNFAMQSSGGAIFSGPVFPIWREKPIDSRLIIEGVRNQDSISCAGCRSVKPNSVSLQFVGLPPPVYFQGTNENLGVSFVEFNPDDVSRVKMERLEESEIASTLDVFARRISPAIKRSAARGRPAWTIRLSRGALIERLVVEQVGEIQLHPSFGAVNPLLSVYHRAAFFRALSRNFARHALEPEINFSSWVELKRNESVARLLAEIWLRDSFPSLSSLKEMSDRFSFLPFFRAIQQGNAFINNSVFVGAEEGPAKLDYSTFQDFLAPMTGADLLAQMDVCLQAAKQQEVRKAAVDVLEGRQSVPDFKKKLSAMEPDKDCSTVIDVGVIPAWTPEEKIEIREMPKSRLAVRRDTLKSGLTHEFLFGETEKQKRGSLRVKLSQNKADDSVTILPIERFQSAFAELPNGTVRAEVLSPHRAISSDRLKYPRPYRTVLQAFAMNYDSRRSDLTIRSQFQTTQLGDDWGRTLTLGVRREYGQNFLGFQISSAIPSLFRETNTTLSLASNTRLVKAPPSFLSVSYSIDSGFGSYMYPEGVGLKVSLRRPLTLSAFREAMTDPQQEWMLTTAVPLASRLTWLENLSYARSDADVDAGLRAVPGWPASTFKSKEYVVLRSEIRNTLTQNLNVSFARSVLFQHAILYGAHVLAIDDLDAARIGSVDTRTAQSVLAGVRLLGALFGAKDQAVGFEVARVLSRPVTTSVGFSLGKALN